MDGWIDMLMYICKYGVYSVDRQWKKIRYEWLYENYLQMNELYFGYGVHIAGSENLTIPSPTVSQQMYKSINSYSCFTNPIIYNQCFCHVFLANTL